MRFSVHCSSLALLSPQFQHRFCQLWRLWSLRLVAAAGTCLGGGGLAAMEKTERQGGRGLPGSRLTVYGDVDPLPSLPRTNTQVLLFRKKKKTDQLWPTARFLLSAPTIVWPLVLRSASLASEPETKRSRICLYPAQQMVVVIAKALIKPSGLRRVQSLLPALPERLPSASSLELEVVSSQVPAGPPAVATPECTVCPVPSPTPCLAQDLALHAVRVPTLCLRS